MAQEKIVNLANSVRLNQQQMSACGRVSPSAETALDPLRTDRVDEN